MTSYGRDSQPAGKRPVDNNAWVIWEYAPDEWAAFVAGVKAGEFDLPADPGSGLVERPLR